VAAPAILKIDIITDTKKATAGLSDTEGATKSLGGTIKKLAGAVATGYAAKKIYDFGKASVEAASNAKVSAARLQAVFRAQGETTNAAANAALAYADKLSRKIGVDHTEIEAGQAILATFKSVSDQTARSAGVFDQATQAAADLAAAGFGSITSNSVQLGKALQDPIKGMTSLRRVGVTLTQAQQDQIKALEKSGQHLQAQKVLLSAIQSQVGGTAAATATSGAKMSVAWHDMQESVGNALLPIISALKMDLIPALDFVGAHANVITPLAIAIGVLGGSMLALSFATKAWAAIQLVARAATLAWTAANWLLNASIWANPITWIILGVAAFVAILVVAYLKVGWFRAGVDAAFRGVVNAVKACISWVAHNWPLLIGILAGPIGVAVALIVMHFDTVKRVAQSVISFVEGIFRGLGSAIGSAVAGLKAVYNGFVRVWNAVPKINVSVPGWVPGIGGKGFQFSLPHLPTLARGAWVTRPTLAVVGEGRGGELVAPENMLRRIVRSEAGRAVEVHVHVPALANPAETGRAVADALRRYFAAGGRLQVPS
jgi:hypothetical protein